MDCEKFDQVVMDALYGELDELTAAALRRHVDTCVRCSDAWSGLRSTREGASLPIEEPSADLESRIMAAALAAQRKTPWHRQILRALAWAGSHAMRPQFAMAALFFLVIGSSLLLLRAKPGTVGTSPVSVTERGVPTPDEPEATPPLPAAAAQGAPPAPTEAQAAAADKRDDSQGKQAAAAENDAAKALAQARATRDRSGCGAAAALYDDIGIRFSGTSAAADAAWEAAQCQKTLGNNSKARELLSSLKSSEGYRQRAEDALRETEASASGGAAAAAPGGGAVASRAAAAPAPAAPPAAKPADPTAAAPAKAKATAPGGGPTRSVPAAPKRNADLNSAYGF